MTQLRGYKIGTTLVLVFKKIQSKDKTKYEHFYLSSKTKIITNESDIVTVFQSIYTTIIGKKRKSPLKYSDWVIDSVIDHTISISKYKVVL